MKQGTATVIKHTGSHYLLSELPEWRLFSATVRGRLRLKESSATNPLAVGDLVEYELPVDEQGEPTGSGAIKNILPRKNYIIRKSSNLSRQAHIIAANIDKAYLVVTLDFPETKWAFIDRFLTTCEAYRVPVKILLNKMDLYGEEYAEILNYFKQVYNGAGYQILELSVLNGSGIEELREECRSSQVRISLFSGISGVGKSSLIKALDPSLSPKIAEISDYHLQGKHTTTFYEMHRLESGGYIIDTPGLRGFGLIDVAPEEVSTYFPEMLKVMDHCKFMPCTHTHEPDCAVKDAVDAGEISPERYNSYLGMLEEGGKYR